MKATKTPAAAATAVLAAVLGSTHHCAQAFLVSAPVRSGSSSSSSSASLPTRSSWASQAAQQQQQRRREGLTGLSMVSATFGEKINTDRIVMDKTAREAVQELYPEACAKHPRFLGEGLRFRAGVMHVSVGQRPTCSSTYCGCFTCSPVPTLLISPVVSVAIHLLVNGLLWRGLQI